jgi:hypothetical protein
MKTDLQQRLEQLAFARSQAFCYQDSIVCPTGICPKCGTDDLMRYVPQVGNEYGVGWIIEHILQEELTPADLEESFEQMVRECYPEETTVGWMTFDTVTLMKEQDPVGWRCALVDYESQEESEGNIISFDNGSTYYFTQDIENLLREEGY